MSRLEAILAGKPNAALKRLSSKTGIEVSRLEELRGGGEPTMGEARRLADALAVAFEDIVGKPSAPAERAEVLFRRSFSRTGSVPMSTSVLARKIASSVELVRERQDIGPSWRRQFAAPEFTISSAEQNAEIFRRTFCGGDQLSPLITLPQIVSDAMGVMLFTIKNSEIDGASAYLDGVPFAFVSERFKGRMLFTLAHEVGHLVAHHTSSEAFAIIDEDVEAVAHKGPNRELEFYADAFASALLMPRVAMGLALKVVRRAAKVGEGQLGDIEINYLARIFGVSFWAAARRCEDLALLPKGGAYALHRALVEQHGSAEKRAEQVGLPPRAEVHFPPVPWSLMEAAVSNVRAGEISLGKAASVVGVSIDRLVAANVPTKH